MSAVNLVWDAQLGSHAVAAVPLDARETAIAVPWSLVIDGPVVAATPVVGPVVAAMYAAARRVMAGEEAASEAMSHEQAVFIDGDAGLQHLALVVWMHYMRYLAPADVVAPWGPYLDTQPDAFPGLLAAYTGAEEAVAAALSDVSHSLNHMRQQEGAVLSALHNHVVAAHPGVYGAATPAAEERWARELTWAARTVATRCFGPKQAGSTIGLYPVLDLVNHEPGAHPTEGTARPEGDGVVMVRVSQRTHRALAAGEQVMGGYQEVPPAVCGFYMLSHYGFVAHRPEEHCMRATVVVGAAVPTDPVSVFRSATIAAAVRCLRCLPRCAGLLS